MIAHIKSMFQEKFMSTKSVFIFILLLSLLTACNLTAPNQKNESPTTPPTALPFPTDLLPISSPTAAIITPPANPKPLNQIILNQASEVVQTLKNQDFISLSSYVHPIDGVRFSPYAFVQETDQIFSNDKVANLMADSKVYSWGAYAGTGESINLSFPEYYSKFIYDVDFADAPQLAFNRRLSSSNSIDNSAEFYPRSMFIEYYYPGFDPQYGGMDWRSLRLVFSEYEDIWYLVGIIHDEWTP